MEPQAGFNSVDLAVIGVILISGLLALFRGFARELLSLAAWIGATIIAVHFFPVLKPHIHNRIKSEGTADVVTGLILFCGSLALLIPIGYFVSSMIRGQALTAIDRSLGFVFGTVRGVLIVCILFMFALWIWPEEKKEPELLAKAKSRPLLAQGAEMMKSFMPKELLEEVEKRNDDKKLEKNLDFLTLESPAAASSTTTAGDAANGITTGDKLGKTPTVDSSLPPTEPMKDKP